MYYCFILLVRIELFFIFVVPCGKQLFGWIHFQPASVVVAEELMDHVIFVTHIHQGVFQQPDKPVTMFPAVPFLLLSGQSCPATRTLADAPFRSLEHTGKLTSLFVEFFISQPDVSKRGVILAV